LQSGCGRKGHYNVRKLIEQYGRNANMMKWKEQLNGDCPKQDAPQLHGRCDVICTNLLGLIDSWRLPNFNSHIAARRRDPFAVRRKLNAHIVLVCPL
jgi:hypothetical protein